MEPTVRRPLIALTLLASLVVAAADRDLLQSRASFIALVNGQYLVSTGNGSWSPPNLNTPGNTYPAVNSAYSAVAPVIAGGGSYSAAPAPWSPTSALPPSSATNLRLGSSPPGVNYIGRLEAYAAWNSAWGTICDDGWMVDGTATASDPQTPNSAPYPVSINTPTGDGNLAVACHQLGFPYGYQPGATAYYGSVPRSNPAVTVTVFDEIVCDAAQVADAKSGGTGRITIDQCANSNGLSGGYSTTIPIATNIPPGQPGCDGNEELWICCPPVGGTCPAGSQGLEALMLSKGFNFNTNTYSGRRHLSSTDGHGRHLANHQTPAVTTDNSPWAPNKAAGINVVAATSSRSNKGRVVIGATALAGVSVGSPSTPSILLTTDSATTFLTVTGVPSYTVTAAVAGGTPITAPLNVAQLPYPPNYAPDINGMYFSPGSGVGWAVGGVTTLVHVPGGVGMMLVTTNGGTVWSKVKLFPTPEEIVAAYASSGAAGAALYGRLFPGVLASVMSTDTGNYVWAVGSPANIIVPSAGGLTNIVGATLNFQVQSNPTILFSGNGGASWAMQTAPVLYFNTPYSLLSVYAATGHRAVAVGGGNDVTLSGGQFGTILYTSNGGFSWIQAQYVGMTGKAPVFAHVTFTPRTKVGWCVGWARPDGFYPTEVSGTVAGTGYSVLVSTNGGVSWSSPPVSAFPAGFVQTGTSTPAKLNHVYGTSWHTPMNGYMFGANFIFSTIDGGTTWVDETPNSVVVGPNAGPVRGIQPDF